LIINFIDPCVTANYIVPTILPDVNLYYMGPAFTFTWTAYQDSISIASSIPEYCGLWTYVWDALNVVPTIYV